MKKRTNASRRGRPAMPPRQRKSRMLCARTDERAYRTYERAAAAANLRLTDWMRDRLSRAAVRDLAA